MLLVLLSNLTLRLDISTFPGTQTNTSYVSVYMWTGLFNQY